MGVNIVKVGAAEPMHFLNAKCMPHHNAIVFFSCFSLYSIKSLDLQGLSMGEVRSPDGCSLERGKEWREEGGTEAP